MKKHYVSCLLALALSAQAHDNHTDEATTLGPHVHGQAYINVVLEEKKLMLSLETPAMNVLGFEHPPMNDEEAKRVVNAKTQLHQPTWLVIDGGQCGASTQTINMPFTAEIVEVEDHHDEHEHHHEDEHHDEHEHHHEDDHHDEHEHHHEDEHHDEHEHHHEDEHHDEHEHHHEHSDIRASYEMTCQEPDQLKDIHINLFDTFAGFEQIQVQWINGSKQGAVTLTTEQRHIDFD